MNKKLQILTTLLIMYASTHCVERQPELSPKSKALIAKYDKALSNQNEAFIEYEKLDPIVKNKIKFDFYKFDFVHHPVAQKYYDASDTVVETKLELADTDPNNFQLPNTTHLYRKLYTHPSWGIYEWVPYEDYDRLADYITTQENLNNFLYNAKAKKAASIAEFDDISQEAIRSIEHLYQWGNEIKANIFRIHTL